MRRLRMQRQRLHVARCASAAAGAAPAAQCPQAARSAASADRRGRASQGLALPSLSKASGGRPGFWRMLDLGLLDTPMFSLWLNPDVSEVAAGEIRFGGASVDRQDGPLVELPVVSDKCAPGFRRASRRRQRAGLGSLAPGGGRAPRAPAAGQRDRARAPAARAQQPRRRWRGGAAVAPAASRPAHRIGRVALGCTGGCSSVAWSAKGWEPRCKYQPACGPGWCGAGGGHGGRRGACASAANAAGPRGAGGRNGRLCPGHGRSASRRAARCATGCAYSVWHARLWAAERREWCTGHACRGTPWAPCADSRAGHELAAAWAARAGATRETIPNSSGAGRVRSRASQSVAAARPEAAAARAAGGRARAVGRVRCLAGAGRRRLRSVRRLHRALGRRGRGRRAALARTLPGAVGLSDAGS